MARKLTKVTGANNLFPTSDLHLVNPMSGCYTIARMQVVDFLKSEFSRRKEKSKGYDGKCFAKEIGISEAYLSLILSGKRKVSEKTALAICNGLKLSAIDREKLMTVYRLESSQDPAYKK